MKSNRWFDAPYFLVLVPAFFLLHNYNELFGFISLVSIGIDALVIYGATFLCFALVQWWIRDSARSAMLLLPVLCFILFYRPWHGLFRTLLGANLLTSYKIFLPACLVLLALLCRKILGLSSVSFKSIRYLNTTLACLLAAEAFSSLYNFRQLKKDHNLIYPGKPLCSSYAPGLRNEKEKPDIFFLVFDEYTNNESLEKIWSFRNDSIGYWLASRGFYIAEHARANYDFTPYSISSTFNMNWIDPGKGNDATKGKNVLQANQSMSDNELFCILRKERYSLHFFAPFKNAVGEEGLGHYFDYLPDGQVFRQTLPGSLEEDIFWNLASPNHDLLGRRAKLESNAREFAAANQKLINLLESSADSTGKSQPKFVYGHFMITHEPHYFDSSGRVQSWFLDSPAFSTYTRQIEYANLVMKKVVAQILTHGRRNTIIIVEGDHGFRRLPEALNDFRFPNLMAVYYPDRNYSALYQTLSPVNLFRILLNKYFSQNYPLLPDSAVLVRQ